VLCGPHDKAMVHHVEHLHVIMLQYRTKKVHEQRKSNKETLLSVSSKKPFNRTLLSQLIM
jgi:hypothetical protein